MKKILLGLLVVVVCVTALYADEGKKQNWFLFDIDNMSAESKAEVRAMYHDAKQSALEGKKQLIRMGDDLATVVENKGTDIEKNKHIQAISHEIVKLTDDGRKAYRDMMVKMHELSGWILEEEVDYDFDRYQNRMFSSYGVKEIYEILNDAGVKELSKKEINTKYGKQIAEVNSQLKLTYYQYLGFWLAGIDSGKDYDNARNAYINATENELNLVITIYNNEIALLDQKSIAKVATERQKSINDQLERIEQQKAKVHKTFAK